MDIGELPNHNEDDHFAFLGKGGVLGSLIRAHDWTSTSVGCVTTWQSCLKTSVALLLQSPIPMVMLWGEDGLMIYNEGYSVIAGARHPGSLGSKVRDSWAEVADFTTMS